MKKIVFLLLTAIVFLPAVQAQINWGEYSHSFPSEVQENPVAVGLILAIRKENNSFWEIRNKSKHFDTLLNDSTFRRLRPHDIVARTTFDTANAQFFLHGVGPHNAQRYQFRVTEFPGNRVIVPWHPVNRFTDSTLNHQSGMPKMAYLGGYRTQLGSVLIMDVRKTGSEQIAATSLIAWESIKPAITSIYTSQTVDEFLRHLQSPWMPQLQSVGHFSPGFSVPSTNTNLIFSLENIPISRHQIQYELTRNGEVFVPWRDNDYDNSFVWIKETPPGRYLLKIRYSAQPQHMAEYRFEVTPVWYQTTWFRLVAGFLILAFLGLLLLFIRQRRKTQLEQATKMKLQFELKAIYTQLNPHFIFNALSSIQGLVNKGDIKGANSYLADFARLLRQSLQHSQKNEIALQEEIQALDTYLKLEQLRFGFSYTIRVDPDINPYETNIPVLLLQPLVENAVKHGVGSLGANGVIELIVSRSGHALILTLTDNGKGFNEAASTPGLGLKLTRDRIALLNQLHQEWQLTLAIRNAVPTGTQIILTFNQWF